MLTELLAARTQMGLSLAFHIVFATAGIGMPLLMVGAEIAWLRTGEPAWLALSKRWAKGTAILFAVGAVSGTVLSFELGLLWPRFMEVAGPLVGLPFAMEGFAFFLEAICLGIVLYGWDRVSPAAHLAAGIGVAVSGALSAAFVISANGFMNTPQGYGVGPDGALVAADPLAAMLNPMAAPMALHALVASWLAIGWVAAATHAWRLRRDPGDPVDRRGLALGLWVAVVATLAQPLTGHVIGGATAHHQPAKLDALEALWETQRGAPFTIGGWPDEAAQTTRYAIEVPKLLSLIAFHHADAEVMGLDAVAPEDRPPVVAAHLAYQIMLATEGLMGVGAVAALATLWRPRWREHPAFLGLVLLLGPVGMIGIEAGWCATELGRQPWIVAGLMRTADAVTPVGGIRISVIGFTLVYLGLAAVTAVLLQRQIAGPAGGGH
ncbi:MAG: cytochrome ubiquinol oxidase subunit I [Myxococcota bacterium]